MILSCIGFWSLYTFISFSFSTRWGIFSALTLLSCVEKSCSVLNLVAVERDWVRTPQLSSKASLIENLYQVVVIAENDEPGLQSTLQISFRPLVEAQNDRTALRVNFKC